MLAGGASTRPALVTFDCTGTLFEPVARIGVLYKRAAVAEAWKASLARAVAAEVLDEDALSAAFRSAFAEADRERPCFGAGACSSEDWWHPVVERTFAAAAAESAGCSEDALRPLLPGAFRTLYHETFVSRAGWRLRPHAADTLSALSAWREARPASETDLKVGVVSNWDDRLPLLLERLGVRRHVDFVLTSREAGVEKPSAELFARARGLAGVAADARCLHVGDSFSRDVVGAAGAGWEALFVCSAEQRAAVGGEALAAVEHAHLESLARLPALLSLGEQPEARGGAHQPSAPVRAAS